MTENPTTGDISRRADPRRNGRGRRTAPSGDAGGAWKQLVADTSDYKPEDDGDLLAWMAGETAGMSMYAEAVTDVYETAVNSVGLDPVAMAALVRRSKRSRPSSGARSASSSRSTPMRS